MARKKSEPKRSHHKKIMLPLPSLAGCPFPEEAVIVPVPLQVADIKPLAVEHDTVRCVVTKIIGWTHDYLVIVAKDGKLPDISEQGTECDVAFSPPSVGEPPYPHD